MEEDLQALDGLCAFALALSRRRAAVVRQRLAQYLGMNPRMSACLRRAFGMNLPQTSQVAGFFGVGIA